MSDRLYSRIMETGLGFIFIFAPLALGAARIWAVTPITLIALALVFVWFWRMNNVTGWNFAPTPLDLPLWTFIVLASVTCIFSIYLYDSLIAMRNLLLMAAIYYLIVNNLGAKAADGLMLLLAAVGTAMSVIGIGQYFLHWPHGWWADERFLTATYVNHNHFAGYLEMAIPLTAGLFFARRGVFMRAYLAAAVLIMAAAFMFAQSRGAWVSLAAGAFLVLSYLSKKRIVKRRVSVIILIIFAALFAGFYFSENTVAGRMATMAKVDEEISFLSRIKIWRGTIDIIIDNPIKGTGIGTLVWGFPRYRPQRLSAKIVHAHNEYLHMAAEMGIMAVPLMIWVAAAVIKRGLGLSNSPVHAGITIGLISIFLHGIVDFNFHIPANFMVTTALCAFLMKNKKNA